MAAFLQAQLPFVPMTCDVAGPDSYHKLLTLQPVRPSVFTAQILLAAEPVRTQAIHTIAPVELILRYTDLSGVEQNTVLARVAKLPTEIPLAMRGKEEGFVATEASPITLFARFLYPIQETTKVIHYHVFVGAFIRQTAI